MKNKFLNLTIAFMAAILMLTPVYGKKGDDWKKGGKGDKGKPKVEQKNDNKGKSHKYQYRGKYKNFKNGNHHNRYFFGGKYHGFNEYYKLYSRDKAHFFYEGRYGSHDNIYIFTDAYGNEFDMHISPVNNLPKGAKYILLSPGNAYRMKVAPYKWYPAQAERRSSLSLSFGWGVLQLTNDKYYEMHTSTHLLSYKGRLYLRN